MTLYFYEHNMVLFIMGMLMGMIVTMIVFAFAIPKDKESDTKTAKPRKSFREFLELIKSKIKEDLSK